jgi:hypothetical protein
VVNATGIVRSAYVALALVAFGIFAGCILAWRARSMLAWRLPYHWAVLGQIGISLTALLASAVLSLAAFSSGFLHGEELAAFGLGIFLLVWWGGLAALIRWFAERAKGLILLKHRLLRLRWATFLTVLCLIYGGGLAAFALLRLAGPPTALVEDQPVAQLPRTAKVPTRVAVPAAQAPTGTMGDGQSAVATAPPAAQREDTLKVIGATQAWAAAWEQRDVGRYLDSYSTRFRTPNGNSRAEWEATRRQRIENAKRIAVRIESPEVVFLDAGTAIVRFRQHYESNIVSETGSKTLVMSFAGGEWRILEERSGGK